MASSAVSLRERQDRNAFLDKQRNVLVAAGLAREGESLTREEIEARFGPVRSVVIDLESGRELPDVDPAVFDPKKVVGDPKTSRPAPPNNAGLDRIPTQALVYRLEEDGELELLILPIEGKGLWSTLYGFIALDEDPGASFAYPDQRFFGDRELVWETQEFDESDLRWANHPTVCSLVRREALEEVGGYDPRLTHGWEDWALWLDFARRGRRGIRVPAPLFRHRRHGKTMTHRAEERNAELRSILLETRAELYTPESLSKVKRRSRPALSVIVPFHDAHAFADETFASLDRQTLRDFETVVVNDGSTHPESLALLDRLRRRPATRVVDRPRGDLAAARNTGVSAARGEYVAFLDADDLLAPRALEVLLWTALLHPEDGFVYPGVFHFGDVEGICLDPYDAERLTRENFLTSMALMRRDLYIAVGGQEEVVTEIYEDWEDAVRA